MQSDKTRKQLRKQLRTFVGARRRVRLKRPIPHEPRHNGFVVAMGMEWVLLYQFHDFYPEGYAALRVRDITDIRSGEHERHWEHMLTMEKLLDSVQTPDDVSLDNISELLRTLERRGKNIIVECEDGDREIEDFYIGRILSLEEKSVRFANFDPQGRWDDSPHVIPLREITQVQFETPYVNTFSKYLQGTCPGIDEG